MSAEQSKTRLTCPECGHDYGDDLDYCPRDGTPLEPAHSAPEAAPGDQTDDPFVGRTLDERFEVTGILGRGGMGAVYRGCQLSVERDVAIKVLRPEASEDENIVRRFFREAQVISKFSHPNIVNLIDFGRESEGGSLYLVMELIDGQPLEAILGRGRLTPEFAVHIAKQTCGALSEPHSHGIVHRDMKPDNLMLVPLSDGRLETKVVDFGVAHALQQGTKLTQTGAVFGTPLYMAPEQAQGAADVDPPADIYALGAMLYRMLSGWTPVGGDTPLQIMFAHVHNEPPPVTAGLPDDAIPEPLADLVHQMLRKAPGDRPDDVLEVRDRLEDIQRDFGMRDVRVDPSIDGLERFGPMLVQGRAARSGDGSTPDAPGTSPPSSSTHETDEELGAALAATAAGDENTFEAGGWDAAADEEVQGQADDPDAKAPNTIGTTWSRTGLLAATGSAAAVVAVAVGAWLLVRQPEQPADASADDPPAASANGKPTQKTTEKTTEKSEKPSDAPPVEPAGAATGRPSVDSTDEKSTSHQETPSDDPTRPSEKPAGKPNSAESGADRPDERPSEGRKMPSEEPDTPRTRSADKPDDDKPDDKPEDSPAAKPEPNQARPTSSEDGADSPNDDPELNVFPVD